MDKSLLIRDDDLKIEFTRIDLFDILPEDVERRDRIITSLNKLEIQQEVLLHKLDEYKSEIERLSNNSDNVDYIIAVSSGVIAAIIDSLWVGEFSYERGKAWGNRKVNDTVMKVAKSQGYKGDRLNGAIKYLEDNFKIPSDNSWKGKGVGITPKSHHLDDLAHHPTIVGLFFSILTQFTKKAYFSNSEGEFIPITITDDGELIGHDIVHKFYAGTINWFFHLISDMSGSNKTSGAGMGIPGPIVSMLKEISGLPLIKNTNLSELLHKIYTKDRFDLRGELAVLHELGRQAVPVIINEVIVRGSYFIRRLYNELKQHDSIRELNWEKIIPYNNRTINRMLTIATGTFTAVDLLDAGVRSAIKTGGTINPAFWESFILRVNFIGIGRFAIACYSDVKMGLELESTKTSFLEKQMEYLYNLNAIVLYKQADMFIEAKSVEKAINELEKKAVEIEEYYRNQWELINTSMNNISGYSQLIDYSNPGLTAQLLEILE